MFKNIIKEQIEVPAQMSYLGQVRDFIEKIGKKYKFSEKIVNSFKLVVDESCTNIIRHGYRDIKNGRIIIRAIVRRKSLTIVLIDQGKSFDPRTVSPPDLKRYVEIGKKGGLGILMMRKLMDDIRYNITPTGNELRLTKIRENENVNKWKSRYEALSLKTKFTFFSTIALILLSFIGYFIIYPQQKKSVATRIFSQTKTIVKNMSEYVYESVYNRDDLDLFKSARSVKEANPDMLSEVFILDQNFNILASDEPRRQIELKLLNLDSLKLVVFDSTNRTQIFSYNSENTPGFLFARTVQDSTVDDAPLGYVVTKVNEAFIDSQIVKSQRNITLIILSILIGSAVLVYYLISQIVAPFHKLAEWVRLVGQGKVDEDEIDIDASDELGEIAQAFNEMTSKFREAQINLIEQQRLQKELQVAQEIQQMLLPQDFPNVEGFEIASYYEAAKEVGGDLFDFVEVDDHTIGIIVADVAGKGVPGSLIMTMIRTALRLEARGNKNPAEVLSRVNRFVMEDMRKGMFVTMFYIILDSRERTISFASAGHNPMILFRGKTKKTYYLNPSGFPVGIKLPDIALFDKTIAYDKIQLHPDDLLIIYTDGVTEAMNSNRTLFGDERFLQTIRQHGNENVADFIQNVRDDLKNFTGGFEQNDDITMVAIKENMKAEEVKIRRLKELFRLVNENALTVSDACEKMGVSTSTYYKYKKIYENHGDEGLLEAVHTFTDIESNHISIEEKTKIYDILRNHPTWGPKRVAKELYSPKYGYTMIDPRKIYSEFIRAKLNTKEKRERFVSRGGKKRLKAPGTPLLTLEGKVILAEEQQAQSGQFVPNFGGNNRKAHIMMSSGVKPKEKEKTLEKSQTTDENRELNEKSTIKSIPEAEGNTKKFDIRNLSREQIQQKLKNPDERKEIIRQLQELKGKKMEN